MPTMIGSNPPSLDAQANLNTASRHYSKAIGELSSGRKIVGTMDNSAALAISDRMQSQIDGATQAVANANDGIALAQTADSALSQISSNLQKVRTLAVQAANATYSSSDRASLNQQAQQLLMQVNTVATQTEYNGQTLLDGSFGTAVFQTGANAGQTSTVDLSQGVTTSQIGQTAAMTSRMTSDGLAGKTLVVRVGAGRTYDVGAAVAGAGAGQDANSAFAAVQAIDGANIAGLTATAENSQMFSMNASDGGALQGRIGESVNLTINGVQVFGDAGYTFQDANGERLSSGDLVNQINAISGRTGVSAALNADGSLQLDAADGRNMTVSQTGVAIIKEHHGTGARLGEALQGTVSLSASSDMTISGTGAASLHGSGGRRDVLRDVFVDAGWAGIVPGAMALLVESNSTPIRVLEALPAVAQLSALAGMGIHAATAVPDGARSYEIGRGSNTLADLDISTAKGALTALHSLDSAISTVSSLQGQIGALQNRFDSTISNLQAGAQSLTAARSQIVDADYASVGATLLTAAVVRQAGIAMVSKANRIPGEVLRLLTESAKAAGAH